MRYATAVVVCFAAAIGCSVASRAQTQPDPATRNAAPLYLQALKRFPDPLPENLLGGPVGQTEDGVQPWDEARLGPILDANMEAIEELRRASKLPECDWGTEFNRSAHGYVPFSMGARVLGRLNTLEGMRLMAKGDSQAALEAWLDGAKFAGDIAKGGPVISQLIGHAVLLPDLQAMTAAAKAGKFSPEQKTQIAAAIGALPPDVFDWSAAYGLEETTGETFWNKVRAAKHPGAAYREISGTKMPSKVKCPSAAEVEAFRALTERAQAALRIPPADAEAALKQLQQQIDRSPLSLSETVPSLVGINKARARVAAAREALLKSVGE